MTFLSPREKRPGSKILLCEFYFLGELRNDFLS